MFMDAPSSSLLLVFILCLISTVGLISFHTYLFEIFKLPKPFLKYLRPQKFVTVKKPEVYPAYRVCKPGPPLGYPEPSSKLKNCLVIGDSISVGYTPFLSERLKNACRVQRSPVDNNYGGARDSRYGRHCLPMFLRTTSGNATFYDVILFNFGLHDVTFLYDKKFMDITLSEYRSNLAFIKEHLGKTGAKLVFLTTTPAPHLPKVNEDIMKYNDEAVKVMTTEPKIAVHDLYQTIVDRCHGNSSEQFQNCGIFRSPSDDHHFNDRGSNEIARHLAERVTGILTDKTSNSTRMLEVPTLSPGWVHCPGNNVVVGCPPGSSCCKIKYTESGVGCCHLSDPIECGDDNHYCDQGWVCDPKCWVMKCFCHRNVTVKTWI